MSETTATESADEQRARRPFYEPGWYKGLTDDQYHGSFGFSSSQIKVLLKQTPAHLRQQLTETSEDTAATALGGAVHAMLLQPERYNDLVAVLPKLNLRSSIDRGVRDDFVAEHAGKSIITDAQKATAERMVESVLSHDYARTLLTDIVPESSVYWWYTSTDLDENGEPFRVMTKVRPDALSIGHPVIVDLKTARDATFTGFQKAILEHGYHVSAAMYQQGINQCTPLLEELRHYAYTTFVFVVVESQPPYPVAVYELSPEFLELGKSQFRRAMRILRDARTNDWPAFPNEIRVIDPPPWANRLHIV